MANRLNLQPNRGATASLSRRLCVCVCARARLCVCKHTQHTHTHTHTHTHQSTKAPGRISQAERAARSLERTCRLFLTDLLAVTVPREEEEEREEEKEEERETREHFWGRNMSRRVTLFCEKKRCPRAVTAAKHKVGSCLCVYTASRMQRREPKVGRRKASERIASDTRHGTSVWYSLSLSMHVSLYLCMCLSLYVCTFMLIQMMMYTHARAHTHTHTHTSVNLCVCVCLCV